MYTYHQVQPNFDFKMRNYKALNTFNPAQSKWKAFSHIEQTTASSSGTVLPQSKHSFSSYYKSLMTLKIFIITSGSFEIGNSDLLVNLVDLLTLANSFNWSCLT